jgi:succinylglutamic semialdehyde dehydrogenase
MIKIRNPNTGNFFQYKKTSPSEVNEKLNHLHSNTWWKNCTLKKRINYLKSFQKQLMKTKNELAQIIAKEIGKPLWESLIEVDISIKKIDVTISALDYRLNYPILQNAGRKIETVMKPLGLVGIIGPFNFPLHIPNGQIIPALITGNCVVVKPSEYAIKTSQFIECLWKKSFKNKNAPIEFCYGDKTTGEQIVQNKNINAIFFTGSSKTGQLIKNACIEKNKLCALEMGGNNSLIIDDLSPHIISNIITSSFITSGQRCSCSRRLLLNETHHTLVKSLIEEIKLIPIKPSGSSNYHFMGPIVLEDIKDLLINKDFKSSETLLKSKNLGKGGLVSPRVELTNQLYDEEIFGPVLFISFYKNIEEAIEQVNKSKYGLSTSIYSKQKKIYDHILKNIDAGVINWNTPTTGASGLAPFGGVKHSGNFRPAGRNMIDHCVIPVATTQQKKPIFLNYRNNS